MHQFHFLKISQANVPAAWRLPFSVYAEFVCLFFFFCLVPANLKKVCYSPLKYCSSCVIRYMLLKRVLVVSVFLEVTLKDYLHVLFPRGLSKLFLKISNDSDSDFPQRSTPVPDYSDD